jgi:serine/threonine-protein kinase RsbW
MSGRRRPGQDSPDLPCEVFKKMASSTAPKTQERPTWPKIRIVISSNPRLLNILRGVVKYRALEIGLAESDAEALALAISEAASNVILHAYGGRHEAMLALEIVSFPDRVEFYLEDSGPKVSAETIQVRPLDGVRSGGLGLHLIDHAMDARSYDENYAGGNRLKMTKFLPRKVSRGNETSA